MNVKRIGFRQASAKTRLPSIGFVAYCLSLSCSLIAQEVPDFFAIAEPKTMELTAGDFIEGPDVRPAMWSERTGKSKIDFVSIESEISIESQTFMPVNLKKRHVFVRTQIEGEEYELGWTALGDDSYGFGKKRRLAIWSNELGKNPATLYETEDGQMQYLHMSFAKEGEEHTSCELGLVQEGDQVYSTWNSTEHHGLNRLTVENDHLQMVVGQFAEDLRGVWQIELPAARKWLHAVDNKLMTMEMRSEHQSARSKFLLRRNTDGTFSIWCVGSEKYFHVSEDDQAGFGPPSKNDETRFELRAVDGEEGVYQIIVKATGKHLHASGLISTRYQTDDVATHFKLHQIEKPAWVMPVPR